MNYLEIIEKQFEKKIPENDNRERMVCKDCNFTYYDNPKIVVGVLPIYKGKLLLCKRAIEPKQGLWTFPCGFLEHDETLEEGAIREAKEEAGIDVTIKDILILYSVPHVHQIHIFFLGELANDYFSAGEESLKVELLNLNEIQDEKIAFSSALFAIKTYEKHINKNQKIPQIGSFSK